MKHFVDYCYIGALLLYVLAGCWLVPFHGDESTIIYMSWDFDALFRRGDLTHLLYRDPPSADDPQSATRQDLRLLNGVINKYAYGAAWSAAGLTASDLNDQWLWGADLNFNQANGHTPSDRLLFVCRIASALLTALSIAVVFVSAWRVGGRRTAYLAAFIYTLMPAILLNGRRAMMESGLLLFSALLIYMAQRVVSRTALSGRQRTGQMLAFGILSGLTIASKHTGVLIVAAALFGIVLHTLLTRSDVIFQRGLFTAGALLVATAIFLALNTAWWSDPLGMPGRVLRARQALLDAQVKLFNGYTGTTQRVLALIREPLSAPPQYYEVEQGWPQWIGGQITRYEAVGLAGLSSTLWSGILGVGFIVGCARAVRRWRQGAVFIVLSGLAVTLIVIYLLTPFDWQRYYLPLITPVAIICGMVVAKRAAG